MVASVAKLPVNVKYISTLVFIQPGTESFANSEYLGDQKIKRKQQTLLGFHVTKGRLETGKGKGVEVVG